MDYWVKHADLQPRDGRTPEKIALDETVIKVDGEQPWLFAAIDPETNVILHIGLFTARTSICIKWFLEELPAKHDIEYAEFYVDDAPWLHAGLHALGIHFAMKHAWIATKLNVYSKR